MKPRLLLAVALTAIVVGFSYAALSITAPLRIIDARLVDVGDCPVVQPGGYNQVTIRGTNLLLNKAGQSLRFDTFHDARVFGFVWFAEANAEYRVMTSDGTSWSWNGITIVGEGEMEMWLQWPTNKIWLTKILKVK